VELIHNPAAKGSGQDPVLTHGFFKAGIIVEDYEGTLSRLRQRGVPVALGPFPARDRQRANFIIRDNAGNLIQFFEG